ncbi:hypothetical protein JCM10213_000870 [Rhodosporidiobolus nylandii]
MAPEAEFFARPDLHGTPPPDGPYKPRRTKDGEPDMDDMRRWNAKWEKTLATAMWFVVHDSYSNIDASSALCDSALWLAKAQTQELANLVGLVSKSFLNSKAGFFLPTLWQELDFNLREEQFFLTLIQAEQEPTVGKDRGLCPEITLENICGGDGSGYLRLLDHFVQSGLDFPEGKTGFNEVIHPVWDKRARIQRNSSGTLQPQDRAVRQQQTEATQVRSRHLYLAYFTLMLTRNLLTLTSSAADPLNDYDREFWPVQKLTRSGQKPSPPPPSMNPHPHWREHYEGKYAGKNVQTKLFGPMAKDRNPDGPERCYACGREASEVQELLDAKKQLSFCSACAKIERRIGYCSRDCQVRHYKLEHKEICGKSLQDAWPAPVFSPAPAVPPPSASAVWQYEHMRLTPGVLYHATNNSNRPPDGWDDSYNFFDGSDVVPVRLPGKHSSVDPPSAWLAARKTLKKLLAVSEPGKTQLEAVAEFAALCVRSASPRSLKDAVVGQIFLDFRCGHEKMLGKFERAVSAAVKRQNAMDEAEVLKRLGELSL